MTVEATMCTVTSSILHLPVRLHSLLPCRMGAMSDFFSLLELQRWHRVEGTSKTKCQAIATERVSAGEGMEMVASTMNKGAVEAMQ